MNLTYPVFLILSIIVFGKAVPISKSIYAFA